MGRTEKFRGSRTHGHGKKARRGAGKRGGRGKAGAFKHRRIWMMKVFGKNYKGKYGFTRHPSLTLGKNTINAGLVAERWGSKDGEVEVNLTELGFEKLLGGGRVAVPMKVTVAEASPRAIEKIEEAGGSVEVDEGEWETVTADDTDEVE